MTTDDDRLARELASEAGRLLLALRAEGGEPDALRKAGDRDVARVPRRPAGRAPAGGRGPVRGGPRRPGEAIRGPGLDRRPAGRDPGVRGAWPDRLGRARGAVGTRKADCGRGGAARPGHGAEHRGAACPPAARGTWAAGPRAGQPDQAACPAGPAGQGSRAGSWFRSARPAPRRPQSSAGPPMPTCTAAASTSGIRPRRSRSRSRRDCTRRGSTVPTWSTTGRTLPCRISLSAQRGSLPRCWMGCAQLVVAAQ